MNRLARIFSFKTTMNRAFSRGSLIAVAMLFAAAVAPLPGGAQPTTDVSFQEIEESLTCQCGCGLTVHSCNHLQCPSALPLRAEIREQMALGKSKDEILAHFGEKYGEKILSAPTTEGFNLLAWVTPFLLVGLGGVFVTIMVRHWVKRRAEAPRPEMPARKTESPYDDVLEKELKNFDA